MKSKISKSPIISVIGLGYVGLPLALKLSEYYPVTGYDIDKTRVKELQNGVDRTNEITSVELFKAKYKLSTNFSDTINSNIYIVTVPTPIDKNNEPDLSFLLLASAYIGKALSLGDIIIFESTVYPGVTENVCGPALEKASSLKSGQDFYLGYSPERINPGDKIHTVDKITKVVAGQNETVTKTIAQIYAKITKGGVFEAANIKTAEAAKVIENAQRDINIAFINEIAMIFNKMGIKTHDVLEVAKTKWNFLPFTPGLVGGHCIDVDPFYLAHIALKHDHVPEIILAGRRINNSFAAFVADQIHLALNESKSLKILVLGLAFKENVPDLRNSKIPTLVSALKKKGHTVSIHDPLVDKSSALAEYTLNILSTLSKKDRFNCIIGAVCHDQYCHMDSKDLTRLLVPGGLLADLKGMWRHITLDKSYSRWEI